MFSSHVCLILCFWIINHSNKLLHNPPQLIIWPSIDKHRPERWERWGKKAVQQFAGLKLHDPGLQVVEDRHTEVDWVLGPQEKAGQQEVGKGVHVEDIEEGLLEPQVDNHGNLNLGKAQGNSHSR